MKKKKVAALDLETVADPACLEFLPEVKPKANLKDPVKIEKDLAEKRKKQISDMGMKPAMNLICCASVCDSKGPKSVSLSEATKSEEKILLETFWNMLKDYDTIITFNGRSFDLMCMYLHGIEHGIRPPINIDYGGYNRAGSNHIDLRLVFSGGDKMAHGKMDFFARKYLGHGKTEGIDGAMVQSYFDMGLHDEIAQYCEEDTRITYDLYLKCLKSGILDTLI